MKILWTGFIVTSLSLIPSTSWAKPVSCSNLESTTYLNASSYHYERLRNPFGNWSESLIPEIEGKFSECLAQYKKKYGEDGFKTQKVVKAKVYFDSVRDEIAANLKIRQFQEGNNQQFKKSYVQLKDGLSRHWIKYSPEKGFENKKVELVRDYISSQPAEGFKGKLPQPLTNIEAEAMLQQVSKNSRLANNYQQFSQDNKIQLKDLGLSSSFEQQIYSAIKMPAQFTHYINETRMQPFLDTYKKYAIKVLQKIEPILSQYQSGKLVLREAVKKSDWQPPNNFEVEQLLEPVIKSHEMLQNRGMDKATLAAIIPGLVQATDARDKYQELHQAIQIAKEENGKAELAVIEKEKRITEQYISRSKTSAIGEQFNSIGYPDAMLSLGRLGNPFDSTYATVQCLSSLYGAVEVTKSGKQVEINFGESNVFGMKPKYTMKLQLVRDYVTQYAIINLVNHEEVAVTTGRDKIYRFVQLVRQCEKRNGIKLIN